MVGRSHEALGDRAAAEGEAKMIDNMVPVFSSSHAHHKGARRKTLGDIRGPRITSRSSGLDAIPPSLDGTDRSERNLEAVALTGQALGAEIEGPEGVRPPPRLACGCPAEFSGERTAGAFRIRYSRYLSACAAGVHQHREARIVLPLRGEFHSDDGRRIFSIDVGEALYRPKEADHSDRYQTPTDCLTLLLPDAGVPRRLDAPIVVRDMALARSALVMRAEVDANDLASELVAEGLAVLISSIVLQRAPQPERGAPRWIGSVREHLDGAGDVLPSLAELSRIVDRDPAYVAATFRRAYGVSVGVYFRRLKLWQARDQIDADPSRSLSEIAQDCGFSDQSHFTRHFRRLIGVAPGAYRSRRRGQR